MEDTLHFKLGKGFGRLLSEISREHIIVGYDPESAYKVFSQSGAPPEYALDLLSGNKVIVVGEDKETCYIVDYNSLDPEVNRSYPNPISWSNWANTKLSESLEYGLNLIGIIKNELYKGGTQKVKTFSEDLFKKLYNIPDTVDLGYTWNGYCTLGLEELLSLWNQRDILESENIQIELLGLLSNFDTFLQSTSKLIPCVSWIFEQYGGGDKDRLIALQNLSYNGNMLLLYIGDYKSNEDSLKTLLSVYKTVDLDDNSDSIISHLNKDKVLKTELEFLRPVDITKGWDAGYISPEGKVYALCGESSQFLHIQLADRIHDLYGWVRPKENIDWELDRRGWIKFHSGLCLYSGYCVSPEIPITNAQKYELARYAKSQGSIKCGYNRKIVTEDDLIGQTEEYYEELFS